MPEESYEEIHDYVAGRLADGYVQEVADAVAAALRARASIAANFQPGDGTRYSLVFTHVESLLLAPPRVWEGHDYPVDATPALGCSGPGAAIATWVEFGSIAADFSCPGFNAGYLGRYFPTAGNASCIALEILFNRIGEAFQRLSSQPVGDPTFVVVPGLPDVAADEHLEAGYEDRIMGDPADD